MSVFDEQSLLRILSGERRDTAAFSLRLFASAVEPFYRLATAVRNAMYDAGLKRAHYLGRPTISVGNITTGGTGKTPVVAWLADALRQSGATPAILLRGYHANADGTSDEADMLRQILANSAGTAIPVATGSDRVASAAKVLNDHPATSVFILDDGMQHRRAARNFELVLIDASRPFGFGHVLPRGLLRESMAGLRRADAFLITHASDATGAQMEMIESELRTHAPSALIFKADHAIIGLRKHEADHKLEKIIGQKYFVASGIGNPAAFEKQLESIIGPAAGIRRFADHYHYTPADVTTLQKAAADASAHAIVVTEKDWVKLARIIGPKTPEIPVFCARLGIRFSGDNAARLLELVKVGIAQNTKQNA